MPTLYHAEQNTEHSGAFGGFMRCSKSHFLLSTPQPFYRSLSFMA